MVDLERAERSAALRVVLTKADKLGRGAASRALAGTRDVIWRDLGEQVTTQLFSATRG